MARPRRRLFGFDRRHDVLWLLRCAGSQRVPAGGQPVLAGRRGQRGRNPDRAGRAAHRGHAAHSQRRSPAGEPSGSAAGCHDLVQPGARLFARSGGRRHPEDRARRAPAADDLDRLPGHRAGVPGFAERAGHPDPRGDLRRLCGARHPVRELHPSDHHHLRPAFGGHRGDPHAHGVQHGADRHRHDRHRHAGRHRQEERHHDGGFRDRAAPRRLESRRRRSAMPRCSASGPS